jgi:hypothetical protein
MLSLKWVEYEIDKAVHEGDNPQNVRDLAALLVVRDFLAASDYATAQSSAQPMAVQDVSAMPVESSALSSIDDIESALKKCMARTPEEAQRLRDSQTMIDIMRG